MSSRRVVRVIFRFLVGVVVCLMVFFELKNIRF